MLQFVPEARLNKFFDTLAGDANRRDIRLSCTIERCWDDSWASFSFSLPRTFFHVAARTFFNDDALRYFSLTWSSLETTPGAMKNSSANCSIFFGNDTWRWFIVANWMFLHNKRRRFSHFPAFRLCWNNWIDRRRVKNPRNVEVAQIEGKKKITRRDYIIQLRRFRGFHTRLSLAQHWNGLSLASCFPTYPIGV